MTSCGFHLTHYQETLQRAINSGYRCMTMQSYLAERATVTGKVLVLRHDVDGPIEHDLALARIESSLGISATYFLRLHAKFYNLLSFDSLRMLRELRSTGAEIGLHFEPGYTAELGLSPLEGLSHERELFERALHTKIHGFSFHEPARAGSFKPSPQELAHAGLDYDAYSETFMHELKYLSDSSARWREGCFCEWIGKSERLYVLTHGFWWYNTTSLENY